MSEEEQTEEEQTEEEQQNPDKAELDCVIKGGHKYVIEIPYEVLYEPNTFFTYK